MSDLSRVSGKMTARAAFYSDDEEYQTNEHRIHNCAQEKKRDEKKSRTLFQFEKIK